MAWYGVRTFYRWPPGSDGLQAYEERVVLFEAQSAEGAIAMAEVEAAEYAEPIPFDVVGCVQSFQMFDTPANGAEVFSLVRTSDLDPDDYVTRFFDTGSERQETGD